MGFQQNIALKLEHTVQLKTRLPFISSSDSFCLITSHNVTWSREMSHLSKISIPIFLYQFFITLKCFILMHTPSQLDIWLQSYEEFVDTKNNINQKNLNTVFAHFSESIFPTSDSFLLIMSHMTFLPLRNDSSGHGRFLTLAI